MTEVRREGTQSGSFELWSPFVFTQEGIAERKQPDGAGTGKSPLALAEVLSHRPPNAARRLNSDSALEVEVRPEAGY
jgi:hypothetical protein